MSSDTYTIQSVLRALDVLIWLGENNGSGRITDIAAELGCSKNTAFRLLQTLMERDFVRQADDSSYELTFKLLNLGEAVLRRTEVDHTGADQAVFHQTGVRPFPTPSPACNSIGLPSFDFHVDVPPMEFLGGLADTGHSTFTLEPTNAHVGQFSFSLDERGRIVGTGVMEHDLLWDSPNYRMMDGSEGGAPVRFREVSTVEFTLTIIQPGDLNEDGVVDGEDLARLLADWGSTVDDETPFLACDLNNDGVVNAVDMALLLSRWSTWF